ncbi:hypothetical protein LAJ61_06750 [Moraxella osloensis]|nr:hypothetical protein [Moraxella osloensis]UAY36379.1 hypothetical protein LAJ61_06750 [Moraxella osloensis]
MNVTSASDRLKKVMRIALVGIKPGDQVMLKGYLRILLRLEADLEWVSANNQQIDLFMVNHDFRHAESVQKLISSKPNTATIYTARSETENGYLSQDLLVLPLKDLEPLSEWLFSQLPFLSGVPVSNKASTAANLTADVAHAYQSATDTIANQRVASNPPAQVANPLSGVAHSAQASAVTNSHTHNAPSQLAESSQSMASSTTTNGTVNDEYLIGFAKIFSQIAQRHNEVLSIKSPAGTLFAYINPKQQRVWEVSEYISCNQPWIISLADDVAANQLDVKNAKNLVQWLWDLASTHGQRFEGLLDSHINYHINSWVKPIHDADQHDHLKIQCVLEARSLTIDELVARSQCSLPQVKKTLIGLFVAGALPASVYQQTIAQLNNKTISQPVTPSMSPAEISLPKMSPAQMTVAEMTPAEIIQNESQPITPSAQPAFVEQPAASATAQSTVPVNQSESAQTQHQPPAPAKPQSKLDEILSRRAMAESSANTLPSIATTHNSAWNNSTTAPEPISASATSSQGSTPPTQETGNNSMMGFLGRLRRRLGL